MSKETKSLLIILVTIAVNILAPILMRDMYKDYTKKSEIVGTPSNEVVINEHISVKDYVYQENLSKINFVQDESSGLYTYSYYFSPVDFDSTQNNYGVFINDYMCTLKNLQAKSISAEHIRHFNDISKEVINTITLDITFEFYTSYSYLLITLDTDDITYFNGFKENPGFVLTLSALNFANTYTEVEIPEDNSCLVEYVVDSATYSTVRLEQGSTLPNIPTAPSVNSLEYYANISLTDIKTPFISSTMVREKIKNGEDVSSFVDENVIKYIKDNNLYDWKD